MKRSSRRVRKTAQQLHDDQTYRLHKQLQNAVARHKLRQTIGGHKRASQLKARSDLVSQGILNPDGTFKRW